MKVNPFLEYRNFFTKAFKLASVQYIGDTAVVIFIWVVGRDFVPSKDFRPVILIEYVELSCIVILLEGVIDIVSPFKNIKCAIYFFL